MNFNTSDGTSPSSVVSELQTQYNNGNLAVNPGPLAAALGQAAADTAWICACAATPDTHGQASVHAAACSMGSLG